MSRKYKNTNTERYPKRGEIWFIVDKKQDFSNSVQGGDRLCIIVSNDIGNSHAPVVEIVYTTTRKKNKLPTHFSVTSTPKPSTVLCEQITTVAKEDLKKYCGKLTAKEKIKLNKCLRKSLGL